MIEHEQTVRSLVSARPDLTISDLRNELTALGINVGRSSVDRFLRRLQLTFKKNPARRRTATWLLGLLLVALFWVVVEAVVWEIGNAAVAEAAWLVMVHRSLSVTILTVIGLRLARRRLSAANCVGTFEIVCGTHDLRSHTRPHAATRVAGRPLNVMTSVRKTS